MNVLIAHYEKCKYDRLSRSNKREEYKNVSRFEVLEGGLEAQEIEAQGLIDEYHEYLVLHFQDGETATFRNSHVDLFKI